MTPILLAAAAAMLAGAGEPIAQVLPIDRTAVPEAIAYPDDAACAGAAPAPLVEEPWVYGGVEYIFWWLREGRLPPMLTTSSQASQGILGRPDTTLLYGGDRLETRHGDQFNGLRPSLGFWFDRDLHDGIYGLTIYVFDPDGTMIELYEEGQKML